jgi:hypothetical protein
MGDVVPEIAETCVRDSEVRGSAEDHLRCHGTLDEKPDYIEVSDSNHKNIYNVILFHYN